MITSLIGVGKLEQIHKTDQWKPGSLVGIW
jgi:hypothetical protein